VTPQEIDMRNHVTHLATALALASLAVACSGRNNSVGNDRRGQSGGNRGTNERVSLRGCIQPAVVGQGYALRHVIVVPPEQQGQGQETMEHPLIPRGSWVHLDAANDMNDDLKKYVNNEVTIVGEVRDTGLNTIGTSGNKPNPQEQAPATNSMANGDAPRIAVEKVNKVAENCAGE
jgi:hypothetical protein